MTYFIISTLGSTIIFLFLGLFVYLKNRKGKINRVFSIWCILIGIWAFGQYKTGIAIEKSAALVWSYVFHSSAALIAIIYFYMVCILLEIRIKKFVLIGGTIIGLFFSICSFTHLIVGNVETIIFFKYYPQPGILYPVYFVYFNIFYIYGILILLKTFNSLSGFKRNQAKYFLFTTVIGIIGASTVWLPLFGIKMIPFGLPLVALSGIVMTYAIVRYRLLDINIALTRAGIFAFVYAIVLGLPFGIGGFIREPLSRIAPTWWWLLPMSLLVVLASAGPFIYMKLQKRIELHLRAEEFKSHEALRRLSHNMLRFTDLDNLLKLIVHQLVKILRLKFAAIYLLDNEKDKYILEDYWRPVQPLESAFTPIREFSKESSLITDLYLRRIPIVTEEVKLFAPKGISPHIKELVSILSHLKANIVIPSFLRNSLLGFVILSDKRTNTVFTQEDLNLLMVLSNEVGLAIENAQFHQKEKMTLVEKSRREALADMAPGASHQFNNRLVSISSSAELLLLKLENIKMDKVKDEDTKNILKDTKTTLELIDQEVYKGKKITSAILKRAKAKVDFQKVNVQGLIENAYRLVLISHSGSGLDKFKEPKFKVDLLNKIPDIFASEALLQDCFYNLIDNAFDAMGDAAKEKPPVYQSEIEAALKHESNSVVIQIKDNGIGLTKENQRKLFTPYFTTKASSNKGSGLGLYIIRDFIERHDGTIRCDSEYGKGTIFTVRLPIEKRNARRK